MYKNSHLAIIDFPETLSSVAPDGSYLLLRGIRQIVGDREVKWVEMIYSHRHRDHIGQARMTHEFLRAEYDGVGISVWSSDGTAAYLATRPAGNHVLPDEIVAKTERIVNVGGVQIKLSQLKGHTEDGLLALILSPKSGDGIAYYADLSTPGSVPFYGFGFTHNLTTYQSTHRELLRHPFRHYISGHGRVGDKRDLSTNLQYTRSVLRQARKSATLFDTARLQETATKVFTPGTIEFGNGALLFSEVVRLRVAFCVRKTIRRWGCHLTGVDLFAESHCLTAGFFVTVE